MRTFMNGRICVRWHAGSFALMDSGHEPPGCTVIRPPEPAVCTRQEARSAKTCRSAAGHPFGKVGSEPVNADSFLPHRVPLADRDCLVFQRVKINSYAVRGADLVLAPVAAA